MKSESLVSEKVNEDLNAPGHFILQRIKRDVSEGKNGGKVLTRFPPEPNGYLHIGHAKALCLNFSLAETFKGECNLRFDDTNPAKEDEHFVESIKKDIRWLGFQWAGDVKFTSDYFEILYAYAEKLIRKGKAYVCDLSQEEIREYRGTLTKAGKESPYRNRSVEENLDLLRRMRAGEFPEGARVLRAKIDMSASNLNLRDPVLYRILFAPHHRTGEAWKIYPTYDFAHGQSDSIEGITHSLCSLEFENHRPLYDWLLDELEIHHPQQIEFARLNLSFTMMSKRKLAALVEEGLVAGWDDPRMPTLAGMRRRGYPPEAIRDFAERVGVAKANSMVDIALLESCVRDYLNRHAQRRMGVLEPLKVIIENYPEGQRETLEIANHPDRPELGKRGVLFSRVLYVERGDYMDNPPRKFYRLGPGREVRLRGAYFITCVGVERDPESGEIKALRCTYDPETRGGAAPDGRKVRGTLHWVSQPGSIEADVRVYDHLFKVEDPDDVAEGEDWRSNFNRDSFKIMEARVESSLQKASGLESYQFERQGYFCVDPIESSPSRPVFNRTVGLRDSWAKKTKKAKRM